jgi:rod shape determining protein RodA
VALIVGVPVALIGLQPDMGAVGLVLLGAATMVWLAGLSWWWVAAGAAAGVVAAPVGWTLLADYQRARVLTFLDPTTDPKGAGYQILQSLYAVASGGWSGQGFLRGTQGRLGFLPEHETDFILAVLAEETGVLGATVALGLLFGLVGAGIAIASRARDRFVALLAAGLAAQLLWQVVVNAGGALGLVPLTGVTLPFLSRGGSSLLVAWATVGVWLSCAGTLDRARPLLSRPVRLGGVARSGEAAAARDAA